MAEILLSLTIIGVVAAITLPSLTGNINERTWNTQRKALYAKFSQAIALMPSLNGYGILTEGNDSTSAVDTAAETFITSGLSKVLKINNICDHEHLEDCGIVTSFTNFGGSRIDTPKTLYELNSHFASASYDNGIENISYSAVDVKSAAFETQNGESILAYYNPVCISQNISTVSEAIFSQRGMCLNLIYDLNGNKGPNTVGKDMGVITVFNPVDPTVVAPMPSSVSNAANNTTIVWDDAMKACRNQDADSRMPNIDELSAMVLNQNVLSLTPNTQFWASYVVQRGYAGTAHTIDGVVGVAGKNNARYLRCVKR